MSYYYDLYIGRSQQRRSIINFRILLMTAYHQSMKVDDRILNGLGVLVAVVRGGSFAIAGKSLNMSQSGVSRAIARLEARIGVRLLERTTRTVTLSEEGRRLYEQIFPLLAGLEEAAASVAGSKDAVRGTLRVNMDPFISQLILGPQLSRFLRQFPSLKLELITRDRLGDLVAEGFDLAIRFGELAREPRGTIDRNGRSTPCEGLGNRTTQYGTLK